MKYSAFTLGPIETNAYVLYGPDGAACIIDPVIRSADMERFIEKNRLSVQCVVITHSHVDHVYEAGYVASIFNVPVYMHPDAEKLRQFFSDSCLLLGFDQTDMIMKYLPLHEGDLFSVGSASLRVMHTPGHSPCSICLVADSFMVTGDLLFQDSVGRYDLPFCSYEALCSSLKRVSTLDERLAVLPGHGQTTTIGQEKRSNEFLLSLT